MNPALPRVLIDPKALSAALEAHRAARGGRAEPCGLALGTISEGRIRVAEVHVMENVHTQPDRAFLLPAAGAIAVVREARARGLGVVGVWHGHLRGPARLSEADAAGLLSAARGPGAEGRSAEVPYVFLVSGGGAGRATVVRAFALRQGEPHEVSLDVEKPS